MRCRCGVDYCIVAIGRDYDVVFFPKQNKLYKRTESTCSLLQDNKMCPISFSVFKEMLSDKRIERSLKSETHL